ncbi:sugar phosphate isomerase/epimerase family protein [Phytoactinopolyspora mesophila]|uniref:TIM barrel protein n=1 Tax=Phytoactinopolyspora mesophila TaxID=2650750 RepID=A0A7K3LXD7_9ACTN|nr:sugar phosphate isomerase/epimerase family protein [Phytoactinopolyspora mesophila]NDL55694.1 TIM barrel protein [Phytoactinopolyspora mesophila]
MSTAKLDLGCHLNVLVAGLDDPGLPAALDVLADAGYSRVVLPPVDPDALDAEKLGAMFATRELTPVAIAGQSPDADVSSLDPTVRAAGSAALRRMVRFTAELGSDQLNGVPYGLFGRPGGPFPRPSLEQSAQLVGHIADEAHEIGITMTFEVLNRYETAAINTAAQALEYIRMSGSEHLRIHLDTFHMAVEEADMAAAIRLAAPRLGYLELGQSGRGPLTTGVVNIPRIVTTALEAGYTGPFGVEAFTRDVLTSEASSALAIWRSPYTDGAALVADAARKINGVVGG